MSFSLLLLADAPLSTGGNKTAIDWEAHMFPQPHDTADLHVPADLLLQLQDHVPEDEMRDPQNYDVYNAKTLLAVKTGRTTGTTFGSVNGFESVTREHPGRKVDAVEVLVLGYDTTETAKNDRFSDEGDSGAMVVDRRGRLVGPVTGGGGTDRSKSYITPYHRLKRQIEGQFGEAHLLPPGFDFLFA